MLSKELSSTNEPAPKKKKIKEINFYRQLWVINSELEQITNAKDLWTDCPRKINISGNSKIISIKNTTKYVSCL